MTTLITGASGHLGFTLTQRLVELGRKVRCLDLVKHPAFDTLPVEYVQADLRDPKSLEAAFQDVDVVYHTAAYISIQMREWPTLEAVNIQGTRNMLAMCQKYPIRRLVHFSSIEALSVLPKDRPISEQNELVSADFSIPYPRSKAAGQRLVLDAIAHGLNAVIIYPTGIIGPNDTRFRAGNQILVKLIKRELPALPKVGYDWVDVRDVVAGAILAEEKAAAGDSFILGNTFAYIPEIAQLMSRFTPIKVPMTVPTWSLQAIQPLMAALEYLSGKPMLINPAVLYPVLHGHSISHEHATQQLGYQPRPLVETIEETIHWLRSLNIGPA